MASTYTEQLEFLRGAVDVPFDERSVSESEYRGWGTNDTDFEGLCVDLALPNHPEGLEGILRKQLDGDEFNVGIDLAGGSNGRVMQDLLARKLISLGLVTNLEDKRAPLVEVHPQLDHIAGNLVSPDTWHKIFDWRNEYAPGGFDVIIHRPVGGLQYLRPQIYQAAANLLLDNLQGGGVALFQVPWSITRSDSSKQLPKLCKNIAPRSDIESIIPSYVPKKDGGKELDCVVIIKS